jgi:hypothetical protein
MIAGLATEIEATARKRSRSRSGPRAVLPRSLLANALLPFETFLFDDGV